MALEGSKTEQTLKHGFTGESHANHRHLKFAAKV